MSEDLGARWFAHMKRGELESAWRVSDEVLRRNAGQSWAHLPRHQQPVWDGTPLDGRRVLVRCYHGLGDTLQFIRYAPLLRGIAAETIVWAQPELLPILGSVAGIDRLEALHDGVPGVEYDVDVEIMELPHVFRSALGTLPCSVPYLHAPVIAIDRDTPLVVGVVSRAGDWGTPRSVPLDALAPLAELDGVSVRLLHPSTTSRREGPFETVGGTDTILGTAGVMQSMDLVITPDTMPAHLAGALGVPVWTLLRHDADWRWLHEPESCAWYPTMRLFRQQAPDDWSSVVERVAAALRERRDALREASAP